MRSKENIVPEWIKSVEFINYDSITEARRVEGGVVSDVWCIQCKGTKVAVRRTELKRESSDKILENLNMAVKYDCLPRGYKAAIMDKCLISYYPWVMGVAMTTSGERIQDILNELTRFHSYSGFTSEKSIYENIFEEATYVKNHLNKCKIFSEKERYILEMICDNILHKLSKQDLFRLLDCRGRMTHGDPKPANIILNPQKVQFIDWDKLCTLSPECDIIYAIFTGHIKHDLKMKGIMESVGQEKGLCGEIIQLAIHFLPDMYLLHDVYILLCTGTRYTYVRDEVFPLWCTWQKMMRVFE